MYAVIVIFLLHACGHCRYLCVDPVDPSTGTTIGRDAMMSIRAGRCFDLRLDSCTFAVHKCSVFHVAARAEASMSCGVVARHGYLQVRSRA